MFYQHPIKWTLEELDKSNGMRVVIFSTNGQIFRENSKFSHYLTVFLRYKDIQCGIM